MRYVVNDIAATPGAGGVFEILKKFYNDVIKNDTENEWFFILAGKYFKETKNVKIIVKDNLKRNPLRKVAFELIYGHKFINGLKPDVYISLQNIATIGVKAQYNFVYLQQSVPFQKIKIFSFLKKNERKLAYYQKIVGNIIKFSIKCSKPFVIVQTHWMKSALIEDHILESRIFVVPPIINISNNETIYNGSGNEFFYPASNYIYKNHVLIYKACNRLDNKRKFNYSVELTIPQNKLFCQNSHIKFIDHIPHSEVMEKYEKKILLFPSYIESFGLPLIEAASKADIIFAADTKFARELLSTYENVFYFKVNDDKRLAFLMEQAIEGKIKAKSKRLNAKTNAQTLLQFIKKLVNK